MNWREWLPQRVLRPWQAVALGLALAAAATLARFTLQGPLGQALPFVTFFPALIIAAALGRFVGGLTCLAGATVGSVLLLIPASAEALWLIGAFWIAGGLVITVAALMADAVRELRSRDGALTENQTQLRTLIAELGHRNRNALFVIMNVVSQSARAATSAADAERIINARLEALLRAQEVVTQADGTSASLEQLVKEALGPFGNERIEVTPSTDIQVASNVAMGLGLLFYELATNAVKYGALSAAAGRISIGWTVDEGFADLTWREVGGPPVFEPEDRGFGSRLLDALLVPQGGKAARRFEPAGVVCEMRIPSVSDSDPARPEDIAALVFARERLEAADEPGAHARSATPRRLRSIA